MYSNIFNEDHRIIKKHEIVCCSGIGKRESQQDSAYYYADDQEIYAVVCDGMGGLSSGEKASLKAITIASEAYEEHMRKRTTGSEWMADCILRADREVFLLTDEDGMDMTCGCTFASVLIRQDQLFWASVGDSRIYVIHGEEYAQVTTDLTYSFYLDGQLESGKINESTYEEEMKQGEALISFVGLGNLELMDRNQVPLQLTDGDIILICSDGLYRTIDSEWIKDILSLASSMDQVPSIIRQLIEGKDAANQDNYTFIAIKCNFQEG